MTTLETEVAVLGAGPAGAVAARQLALSGVSVTLLDAGERASKHAIESFPVSGAPLAEEIGLLENLCAVSYGPAESIHLNWRASPERRQFEGDGPLLLRRDQVHELLRQSAVSAGARLCTGRVRQVSPEPNSVQVLTDRVSIKASVVLDARGRVAVARPSDDLVALPFSARLKSDYPSHMLLEAFEVGWLWAALAHADECSCIFFGPSMAFAGLNDAARFALIKEQVNSSSFLNQADVQSVERPVPAGLSFVADPVVANRQILIGDAALARDPIASHGLVHAMRSAVQGAVVAKTLMRGEGNNQAALAFVRHKHCDAMEAARRATRAAYADQAKFNTPFWTEFAKHDPPDLQQPRLDPAAPVSAPLTRAPVLTAQIIDWAPAIHLHRTKDYFVVHKGITALDVATACRPVAPLDEVCRRLEQRHDPEHVKEALAKLWAGGAFDQAIVAA